MSSYQYFTIFSNRTEQELQIAREELRASLRRHGQMAHTLNARLLADFLAQVAASEQLQKQQLRDDAMQMVRAGIEGLSDETLRARLTPSPDEGTDGDHPLIETKQSVSAVSYDDLILPGDF